MNPTTDPTRSVTYHVENMQGSRPLEQVDCSTNGHSTKATATHTLLNVPIPRRNRTPSPDPDNLSIFSNDSFDFAELHRVRSSFSNADDEASIPTLHPSHSALVGWHYRLNASWVRNKGLALVVIAQMFGTCMNIGTRLLEHLGRDEEGKGGMHPFHIIFVRMSITTALSCAYMWYTKTPDFPFGARGLRTILVARGVGGFFGVFGLWCTLYLTPYSPQSPYPPANPSSKPRLTSKGSLQYLPLADATVLTFLAPFIACAVCAKILHEPFTRIDQIGGFVSILGVVLIARPTTLFSTTSTSDPTSSTPSIDPRATTEAPHEASAHDRLAAVGMAMLGVCGAAIAYTTIRWIGVRAHPLISCNYMAMSCTLFSSSFLLLPSGPAFQLPHSWTECALLALVTLGGFGAQFLMTCGLRYEKSSRATNMVYSQMLFAIAADRVIWGSVPGAWSLGGSALILGSAVVIAVQKEGKVILEGKEREVGSGRGDEETALVGGVDGMDGVEVEMEEARLGQGEGRARERERDGLAI